MRLLVFAGLPGSGKTHLARRVAQRIGTTFLRVDTIEAAIATTLAPFENNPVGYIAAEWVAEEQLRSGRDVVIDAVNNVDIARQGWTNLARRTGARLHFIEVLCSDPVEHRRRVEDRTPDWPGQGAPTWDQVRQREWQPFSVTRLLVDNLGDPEPHVAWILQQVASAPGVPLGG